MTGFSDFHFLRPYWLLALLPLAVLLWLMIKKRLGSRSWEMVCDKELLPYILTGRAVTRRRLSVLLTALGGFLAIASLAGPVWEKLPQPVFTRESSLVIALDLSRSMDADDVSPSRLMRARFKIADILKQRTDGQTALLVYAGDSFTVTPLTDDTETIASQLTALSTGIMPVQGNNTLSALKRAEELLKQAGAAEGDILLITDEIDYETVKEYMSSLGAQGYRISVLGVGTEQGVPIPLADGGFLKDREGKIVVPVLEERPMRILADSGGGIYQRIDLGDADITRLLDYFDSHGLEGKVESTDLKTDTWKEQGPWLLVLLLPLIAMMFRRGYIVVIIILILPYPNESQAMDWNNLWSRPDQQGQRAFDAGDMEKAVELFRDPAWKASAQYKKGDYEGAIESLQQLDDTENLYNMGNAVARTGNYSDAISIYDEVIRRNPDHEDAKYNRELVQKELDKQQQQDQQPNSGGDQDDDRQQEDQQQQQSQAGQDSQEQQQQQQAEQEQQQQEQQQQQSLGNNESQQQQQDQLAQTDLTPPDEDQQATEQWLRRIPDDPAGLLRRKFRYQYQQRGYANQSEEKTW